MGDKPKETWLRSHAVTGRIDKLSIIIHGTGQRSIQAGICTNKRRDAAYGTRIGRRRNY